MSLPSNNMMEMHIRSKPMGRRQRAGDEDSEESVGLGQISKIFAAIGIFFTYPLQLNAAYHYIVDELHIDNKDLIKYGLRVLLMIELTRNDSMPKYAPLICKKREKMGLTLLTLVIAMISPFHFQYIMGLLGSLCLSVLTLIVPGLTTFCTKNYGKKYWMGIVAVIALIEGIITFIGSTGKNIIEWSCADNSNYELYC
uniref:Amino acid transporter transmembrane domain-containing protein n=1 Tax=Glossina palpalis gambiensis TaxID=67801 RepID=A0A1B0AKD3_9MUSC